jgi:hypothetical protein
VAVPEAASQVLSAHSDSLAVFYAWRDTGHLDATTAVLVINLPEIGAREASPRVGVI